MSSNINAIQGLGEPVAQSIADPGAGNDIVLNVPAGEIWEILMFQYVITTDATAGNRGINLLLTVNSQTFRNYSNRLVPPNTNPGEQHDWLREKQDYYVAVGSYPAGSHNYRMNFIRINGSGTGNNRISTNTNNLAAADTFTNAKIMYLRWKI